MAITTVEEQIDERLNDIEDKIDAICDKLGVDLNSSEVDELLEDSEDEDEETEEETPEPKKVPQETKESPKVEPKPVVEEVGVEFA